MATTVTVRGVDYNLQDADACLCMVIQDLINAINKARVKE